MSRSERDPFLSESILILSLRLFCLSSDEEPIFFGNTLIMVVVSRRCAVIAHSTLALVKDFGVICGPMLTKCDRLFRSIPGDFGVIHGITLAGFLVLCLR